MAVIITNIKMPSNCGDCKLGSICQKGYGYQRSSDCPLRSVDEMIKEVSTLSDTKVHENTITVTSWEGMKKKILDIVHKYCKEQTDGKDNI